MKYIITENQYKRILSENKLSVIQKLVDSQITDRYDFVCKVVVTPPHFYNKQYAANVYFKDIDIRAMNIPNYWRMKEEVLDEVWHIIYDFTNETVSLYQKSC